VRISSRIIVFGINYIVKISELLVIRCYLIFLYFADKSILKRKREREREREREECVCTHILYIIYKISRANCNLLALILIDTEKSRIYIFDYIDFIDGTKNIERQKCSPKMLIPIVGAQKARNRSSFARGTEYSVERLRDER